MLKNSNALRMFNWVVLILIFLVVIAGSFVRTTGSGMGCPDWPKCFGQWVPPTAENQLPQDYRDVYSEKREKKILKFTRFLSSIGFTDAAQKIEKDPTLRIEEPFNARKTWTEYVNRLVGFLAGNGMLLAFIWLLIYHRKNNLVILSLINLVIMGFQAWFGSIVVASNLVPWTITVHMLLALVIIALQMRVIWLMLPNDSRTPLPLPRWVQHVIVACGVITAYQIFLGTNVREGIDELVKNNVAREFWVNELGLEFIIHRSFSWLVLFIVLALAIRNETKEKYSGIRWILIILALELVGGVLLAHADMPGLVRNSHLLFACVLFGLFTWMSFKYFLNEKTP